MRGRGRTGKAAAAAAERARKLEKLRERTEFTGTAWDVRRTLANEEWIAMTVITRDGEFSCVGTTPDRVDAGDRVTVVGEWESNPRYGWQLRARDVSLAPPQTARGARRFLVKIVPGLGEAMADAIADRFGHDTCRVIEEEPERLLEVKGVGKKRMEAIADAWNENRGRSRFVTWAGDHGVSPAEASKIYSKYKGRARDVTEGNPYGLIGEIKGIGFKRADEIALKVGVGRDSEERVKAGLADALKRASMNGDVCLPYRELTYEARKSLGLPEAKIRESFDGNCGPDGDFALEDGMAYLRPDMVKEEYLARRLARMSARKEKLDFGKPDDGREYDPEQLEAIRAAAENGVCVITGGPGTGKTTIIRAIVKGYVRTGTKFALAAPTGKAAKRMEESLKGERKAKTIHRLLEYAPTGGFARGPYNPLDEDAVIVDESSMLDASLAWSLVRALKPGARLVLVGDADQLPSVGAGNVLADVMASGVVPTVRLETTHRQAKGSDIVENARAINRGEMIDMSRPDGSDFVYELYRDEAAIPGEVVRLVTKVMPNHGFDPEDVQVLTPTRKNDVGTKELNRRLQDAINPDGKEVACGGRDVEAGRARFRVGDRVMQQKNDYEKGAFNGTVGKIVSFKKEKEADGSVWENPKGFTVEFDDGTTADYSSADADELELAYACTVHKSQGSQYGAVVIPLSSSQYVGLRTKRLLYTAVTRAKRMCVLVGDEEIVWKCVKNSFDEARRTMLSERLVRAAEEIAAEDGGGKKEKAESA